MLLKQKQEQGTANLKTKKRPQKHQTVNSAENQVSMVGLICRPFWCPVERKFGEVELRTVEAVDDER